jgi:hypothetical protein
MVRKLSCLVLLAAFSVASLCAEIAEIPAAELTQPPTRARLEEIQARARRDGWAPQTAPLRTAALASYRRGNIYVADAWFHAYAWVALFGENETDFIPRWVDAVNNAHAGHANMPRDYAPRNVPLGAALSPDLQLWLLNNAAFSEEFFGLLSPLDYLPNVFSTLDTLWRSERRRFLSYPNLALAIAIVYDVPPPPDWPHGQVTSAALPRHLPSPLDAFRWWTRQDEGGRTFQSLRRLPAEDLKFLVDSAAPFAELEWAQRSVNVSLGDLPKAYSMIRYRVDRLKKQQSIWTDPSYRLRDILAAGGICADQAYFATQVGKARGVPTLLFIGAGNDGRHAWFGYLDGAQQWQLDAGRYAEQHFVTGITRDPQTWAQITDHELRFLAEHFRALPSFRQSRIHEEFAALMLLSGDPAGAAAAARKAVNFEGRNQPAWETLISATKQQSSDPRPVEALMREAALAFHRYPDLEVAYVSRVVDSLRARGQASEASAEITRLAHKFQGDRVDLSIQEARDIVRQAIATAPLEEQVRTYNYAVDTFGPGAGIGFFDTVVRLFVDHLMQLQNRKEALRAIERARHTLSVSPHSQLEAELDKLQQTVLGHSPESQ